MNGQVLTIICKCASKSGAGLIMSLRNKISFDMVTKIQSGTNWVKNLSNNMKCLNNEKHEELGLQSSFKVYFGKNSNVLVSCGLSES